MKTRREREEKIWRREDEVSDHDTIEGEDVDDREYSVMITLFCLFLL